MKKYRNVYLNSDRGNNSISEIYALLCNFNIGMDNEHQHTTNLIYTYPSLQLDALAHHVIKANEIIAKGLQSLGKMFNASYDDDADITSEDIAAYMDLISLIANVQQANNYLKTLIDKELKRR